jgi:hypothetical protein
VLFAGNSDLEERLDDTWIWDGSTWTQVFPTVSPSPRGFNTQAMAYDAAIGKVILFGGYGVDGFLGDTWVWDGKAKTWTQLFPATSPSPRGTALAYDSNTHQVVIFGGQNQDEGFRFLGDTWTFDGTDWTQQFPASSPSPRANFPMAYDLNIGEVVLYGGFSESAAALGDTWTWNGTTWSQIQTPIAPAGRYGASLNYDLNFEGLVMFGGQDPSAWTNQTWLFTSVK